MNSEDKFKNLPQNKASGSTADVDHLNNPNPQNATDKLNKLQVRFVYLLAPLIKTKALQNRLVINIKTPETAK